jgi:iron complex outermembrane receptor protein
LQAQDAAAECLDVVLAFWPAAAAEDGDIVVTGSRIARQGFDLPTPTTVIGAAELRQGSRPNLQQVLNDIPQVQPTLTPQNAVGNLGAGVAPVDLRALGTNRTLTLLNKRRFVGDGNLNFVPLNLVDRVEIVTGGASAAWGSGADAGVVNIILKNKLEGISVGAQSGVSSRGDGMRYGYDGSFGTSFAEGRGHFLVGAEYLKDKGIPDRNSRTNLQSPALVPSGSGLALTRDVNLGNVARDGLIRSGVLAGMVFNADGSLRPFRAGTPIGTAAFPAQMIGGQDGVNIYDSVPGASPFDRLSVFSRLSFDVGRATIWAEGGYSRSRSTTPLFGDFLPGALGGPLTIQATNPFLSPAVRARLAAAGETSFTLGRFFDDILELQYHALRQSKEGALGIDGTFGKGVKYRAWFSHGVLDTQQSISNTRITSRFNKALNAVLSGGQIVCAVNADAITTNDDPACQPLNPFGQFASSAQARAYVTGTQRSFTTQKLDSTGVELSGNLFSLWAGPVAAAAGVEARWEQQISSRDAFTIATAAAGDFGQPVFTSDTSGRFNVKEAFGEIASPLLDLPNIVKLEVNGAARYSDYSTSGGIWSWKVGGTARVANDLLLRATYSRDIRSPSISELYAIRSINIGPVNDLDNPAGRAAANPGYNPTPALARTILGGNPNLVPEISHTKVFGATYSPSQVPGLRLSVDFYDIKIDGAIAVLTASNLTLACTRGNTAACARITRDSTGTVTEVQSNQQNIAKFVTRGIDMEASYLLNLANVSNRLNGALQFRLLATHVNKLTFDTGVAQIDTAGDVGDSVLRATPKWRGTFSINYLGNNFGIDARLRYVGGGNVDRTLTTLINNHISARKYVDIGAHVKVLDRFSIFGNINNLFDEKPPLSLVGNTLYDITGTYFTAGIRVKF